MTVSDLWSQTEPGLQACSARVLHFRPRSGKPYLPDSCLFCFDVRIETDIAWAAGFFDAEGTFVCSSAPGPRVGALRLQVPQSDKCGTRVALEKFQSAVGAGHIYGPNKRRVHTFFVARQADFIEVTRRLVPYLGEVKRRQLAICLSMAIQAFDNKQRRRRESDPGSLRSLLQLVEAASVVVDRDPTSEIGRAWAAGLFDGDGCACLSHSAPKTGGHFTLVRANVSQSSIDGVPNVLTRFQSAVGFGRVYGPYEPPFPQIPKYVWVISTYAEVLALAQMLDAHLTPYKRSQFARALEAYASLRPLLTAAPRFATEVRDDRDRAQVEVTIR